MNCPTCNRFLAVAVRCAWCHTPVPMKEGTHKFIVMASFCEYMAHLHTEAVDEAEAIRKWHLAFTEEQKKGLTIHVSNCTTAPWMLEHFKVNDDGSDFAHYSGGYCYDYY